VERDPSNVKEYSYVFSDNDSCEDGQINLKSFKCSYKIRDPYLNVVAEDDGINCLTAETNIEDDKALIKAWIKQQSEDYKIKVFRDSLVGSYRPNIMFTSSTGWKNGEDVY
jgi:hypothetical protein